MNNDAPIVPDPTIHKIKRIYKYVLLGSFAVIMVVVLLGWLALLGWLLARGLMFVSGMSM